MIYQGIKRVLDITMAIIGLCCAIPLLVPLWLVMGSFNQQRLGINSKPFVMLKLKTMRDGQEEDKQRLTTLGAFCRRYSIDELPQLLNVLKGEMSIIGPRPLPVRYDTRIKGEYRRRCEVKPGITGLAQVKGRNLLSWKEKFEYDLQYVSKLSFRQDLSILAATFKVLLSGKGVDAGEDIIMEEFKGFD